MLTFAVPSLTKREHSSAGSEHLPYKQRVRGSNPFAPTNLTRRCRKTSFLFLCSFFITIDSHGCLFFVLGLVGWSEVALCCNARYAVSNLGKLGKLGSLGRLP